MVASPEDFCKFTKTPFLAEVLAEALSYKYDEKPNYNKMTFLLVKQLLGMDLLPNTHFKFEQQNNISTSSVHVSQFSSDSSLVAISDANHSIGYKSIYK